MATSAERGLDVYVVDTDMKALKRALRDSGTAAQKAMRDDLKPAGEIIKDKITANTPVQTIRAGSSKRKATRRGVNESGKKKTHAPGLLKRSTKVKVTNALNVSVFNDAKTYGSSGTGYRYGKRLEYDPKFGYEKGVEGSSRHAWFYPAVTAARAQAKAKFDNVLESAIAEWRKP